jgi:hypothetical protein
MAAAGLLLSDMCSHATHVLCWLYWLEMVGYAALAAVLYNSWQQLSMLCMVNIIWCVVHLRAALKLNVPVTDSEHLLSYRQAAMMAQSGWPWL